MEHTFTNELGNNIYMSVTQNDDGVHVIAEGPTTLLEHVWTPWEAIVLRDLFMYLPIEDPLLDE